MVSLVWKDAQLHTLCITQNAIITQIYITSHLLVLNICRDWVNLTEVPEGDWLYDQCFTTPAHLPLGGPPDNNTVPSEESILVVIHR